MGIHILVKKNHLTTSLTRSLNIDILNSCYITYTRYRRCLRLLRSTFLAKQFQHHILCSRKDRVVRASKEVLHKLQFFVELLHSKVCEAVLNTPIEKKTSRATPRYYLYPS
jgi:hypothetical protein